MEGLQESGSGRRVGYASLLSAATPAVARITFITAATRTEAWGPGVFKVSRGTTTPSAEVTTRSATALVGSAAISYRDEERRTRSEQTGDIRPRDEVTSSICGLVAGAYPARITVSRTRRYGRQRMRARRQLSSLQRERGDAPPIELLQYW